jgi:predicted 3-demethylubiquinone-9 3-methyltransferase (glyoxalase superfamily)
MQKIVPHLWFDTQAGEAAEFYTGVFPDSFIKNRSIKEGTPSGTVEILMIQLSGQDFQLISAGPYLTFTPAVSFLVSCDTKNEVDRLWRHLHEGGRDLMPIGSYPFSERYGWLEDRYGLSWQILYNGGRKPDQRITPTLMFVGDTCGKAEEAIRFYASVFRNSKVGEILRYGPNEPPDKDGTIKHASFFLEGQGFAAMDSAHPHDFSFNEAVSLIVSCKTQEEIDYYWEKLSAHPESEQCGWLKDAYGFSWQIVPTIMEELMGNGDPTIARRVTEAFLGMKKFDIAELRSAGGALG